MAKHYFIAGRRFNRRSIVKLTADERALATEVGRVTVKYPVEWPIPEIAPDFTHARIDEGGTDIWGAGPYLKVPNRQDGNVVENRVFCPWGYPPDRVRLSRTKTYFEIAGVTLERIADGTWQWHLELRLVAHAGR